MTDILAEAIRAVHAEMLKEAKTCFVGGVCRSLPCNCAETFTAAALRAVARYAATSPSEREGE